MKIGDEDNHCCEEEESVRSSGLKRQPSPSGPEAAPVKHPFTPKDTINRATSSSHKGSSRDKGRHGGGVQTISDLNPKARPLHFTLLFINGTYGWHPDIKHDKDKNRVTAREFYAYHLNVRNTHSDYIRLGYIILLG